MNAVSVVADLADRSTAMPIIGPPGVPPLNERDLVTAVLDTTAALIVVMDRCIKVEHHRLL